MLQLLSTLIFIAWFMFHAEHRKRFVIPSSTPDDGHNDA
jgi:hypothetical protein